MDAPRGPCPNLNNRKSFRKMNICFYIVVALLFIFILSFGTIHCSITSIIFQFSYLKDPNLFICFLYRYKFRYFYSQEACISLFQLPLHFSYHLLLSSGLSLDSLPVVSFLSLYWCFLMLIQDSPRNFFD